jgi:hypothetical protein
MSNPTAKWMSFNVNNHVRVKLTSAGLAELRRQGNELRARFPKLPPYEPPKPDADGWYRFQAWNLMQDLGHLMYLGCSDQPFETEIQLELPRSAPEPSAEHWPAGVFDATKRPVTIKALQWTGGNLRDVIAFTGRHESSKDWTWDRFEDVVRRDGLKIFTLEGSHMATVGDFIIRGVHGEFYPCKPDIFAKTYTTESSPEPECTPIGSNLPAAAETGSGAGGACSSGEPAADVAALKRSLMAAVSRLSYVSHCGADEDKDVTAKIIGDARKLLGAREVVPHRSGGGGLSTTKAGES